MVSFLISIGTIAVALGASAFAVTRSDIQLILGSVLCLGGLGLIGIAMILNDVRKLSATAQTETAGSGQPPHSPQ